MTQRSQVGPTGHEHKPAPGDAAKAEGERPQPIAASLASALGSPDEPSGGSLADQRLSVAQRQALVVRIGQIQGNQHLQRILSALPAATHRQPPAPPRPGGKAAAVERQMPGSSIAGYLRSFQPPQVWRMPAPRATRPGVLMRYVAADGAKAGGAKTFSLALYDHNVEHMTAWPSAQRALMAQWGKFIATGKGTGKWYETLKAKGLLKDTFTTKLADQAKYLKYTEDVKSLKKKIKKAGKKGKADLQKQLDEMKAVLPIKDVQDVVVETAKTNQRNVFKGWAEGWAKTFGAEAYAVMEAKEAEAKLEERIASNSPAQLQNLALFGHGSGGSGWLKMGDVGKMLLKSTVKAGLAPNLRVMLYMCSAGEGNEKSFAAKLAGKLTKASISGAEVWAHTDSGSAVDNPDWIKFTDQKAGSTFYKMIFDAGFVKSEEARLAGLYGGQAALLKLADGILLVKKPMSLDAVAAKWFDRSGQNPTTAEYIRAAPMKMDDSVSKMRVEWSKFIDQRLAEKAGAAKKGK